jgi:hypothetical protein
MKRFKLSNILCALVLGMVSLSSFVPLAQATDCIVHIGAGCSCTVNSDCSLDCTCTVS